MSDSGLNSVKVRSSRAIRPDEVPPPITATPVPMVFQPAPGMNCISFDYQIGGRLVPGFSMPSAVTDREPDLMGLIDEAGFISQMGETYGTRDNNSLSVYRANHLAARWLFVFHDGWTRCYIRVTGWPSYLDALGRYLPIACHSDTLAERVEERFRRENN